MGARLPGCRVECLHRKRVGRVDAARAQRVTQSRVKIGAALVLAQRAFARRLVVVPLGIAHSAPRLLTARLVRAV